MIISLDTNFTQKKWKIWSQSIKILFRLLMKINKIEINELNFYKKNGWS